MIEFEDNVGSAVPSEELRSLVEALLMARVAARAGKDWPEADRIRGEIDALGVIVMDSPTGATWRLKEPS